MNGSRCWNREFVNDLCEFVDPGNRAEVSIAGISMVHSCIPNKCLLQKLSRFMGIQVEASNRH